MFCIIFSLIYLLVPTIATNSKGPDPWEAGVKSHRTDDEFETAVDSLLKAASIESSSSCHEECDVGAWFYKNLLRFILSNGKFKDDNSGYMEGLLQFKIPVSDYKQLEVLTSSETKINSDGYRMGHKLIMESLVTSKFDYLRETMLTRVTQMINENYMYGVYTLALITVLYYLRWLSKRIVLNSKFTVVSAFFITYIWEVMIILKESEQESYVELQKSLSSCSFWFWNSECYVNIPSVAEWWKKFHPGVITIRVISRLIYSPIMWFLEDVVKKLSDEFMWPFNQIMHVGLSIITILAFIYMSISFIANFVFGKTVKMDLFFNFLNITLGSSSGPDITYSSQPNQHGHSNSTDSISGDNLKMFLKLSNKLIDKSKSDSSTSTMDNSGRVNRKPCITLAKRTIGKSLNKGSSQKYSWKRNLNLALYKNVEISEKGDGDASVKKTN